MTTPANKEAILTIEVDQAFINNGALPAQVDAQPFLSERENANGVRWLVGSMVCDTEAERDDVVAFFKEKYGRDVVPIIYPPTVAASPSVQGESTDSLPPLPKMFGTIDVWGDDDSYQTCVEGYTADQMRGYAIDARLARTAAPSEQERRYATQIATALWEAHYKADAPQWRVLNDLYGALSQIDNMTYGLTRKPAVAASIEGLAIPKWWERIGCTRNPGCNTGEESARDAEIADLRTALARIAALAAEAPILPPMPKAMCKHPKLGDMFDRLQMHFYATRHAEGLARLYDIAVADRAPSTEQAKPELASVDRIAQQTADHLMNCWSSTKGGMRAMIHRAVTQAILAALPVPHHVNDAVEMVPQASGERDAWVSVEDRLPGKQGQDSEEVLCFLSGHCQAFDMDCRQGAGWGIRLGYYDAERGMFRTHGRPDESVTHWMPLPGAPSSAATTSKPDGEGV